MEKCVVNWLERKTDNYLSDVFDEIERARRKFPTNDLLAVALTEEVGELAKALLDESPDRIYAEAVQVACVACRIATEGDCTIQAWRAKRDRKDER